MSGYWVPVCHASDVANPGDFVALPMFADGNSVAVTNFHNKVSVWNNRCNHRGAIVHTKLSGNGPPVCGYHGRCAQPSVIKEVQSCQSHGWYSAHLGNILIEDCPSVGMDLFRQAPKDMKLHSTLRFVMQCHWTVAIENALDSDHVSTVHKNSLASLQLSPAKNGIDLLPDGSSVERFESGLVMRLDKLQEYFSQNIPVQPYRRYRINTPFMGGFDTEFDYVHTHVFPYTCLSSTRGFTYSLQHYIPRKDGHTDFIHRLYVPKSRRDMSHYFDTVRRMNEKVFLEDAAICMNVPPYHNSVLGKGEERIAHFRAMLDLRTDLQ